MQSRFAVTLFFLVSSIITGFYLVYRLAIDHSFSSWIGLLVGTILAISSCYFLLNPAKAEEEAIVNLESTSQWMIVTVIGGILLAEIVSATFSTPLQNAIDNSVSVWIVIVFGWMGILAWRYMPKD